jgi:hypothetical protein
VQYQDSMNIHASPHKLVLGLYKSLTPRGMLMHQRTSYLKGLGMFWLGFIGSWFAMDSIDVGSGRHID